MTQVFKDMMCLFKSAAHGTQLDTKISSNLSEVFKKAEKQGILPLILVAVKQQYKDRAIIIDGHTLEQYNKGLMVYVVKNMQNSIIANNAVHKLVESGISCCVLKGNTLANLYCNPDCRISSDTDVYIGSDKMVKKAIGILKKQGFEFCRRGTTSHHAKGYHKIAGLMELHTYLYDELFVDVWFDNKALLTEPYRMVKAPDGCNIPTLGITDGLVFIWLHFIKHFLSHGVGIRQLMDILLYIKHYKSEINYQRFADLMKHLKFDKFIDNAIGIGVKYLGFEEADLYPAVCDKKLMDEILTDIENGGVFGQDEIWRNKFYETYTNHRFNRFKSGNYNNYIKYWKSENIFKAFFLDINNMKRKYHYVDRCSFLLPIAWLHRGITFLLSLSVRKAKKDKGDCVDDSCAVDKRMELIRRLDMI